MCTEDEIYCLMKQNLIFLIGVLPQIKKIRDEVMNDFLQTPCVQCFAHRDWNLSFLTFWSITQPYYMLCMWETYQHDPQSLLIKIIRLISGQVTVT